MALEIEPLSPGFGGLVRGVDLARPIEDPTAIRRALDQWGFLLYRDQSLTPAQQIAFAALFGPLDRRAGYALNRDTTAGELESYAELSNTPIPGQPWTPDNPRRRVLIANELWHSDTSFKAVPAKATILSAAAVPPERGETEFADLRAAWDDLPQARQRALRDLRVVHDVFHSRATAGFTDFTEADRAALPPVVQPLVRRHSGSGRISLYLGSHASHVVGWPIAQGRALLAELTRFATQDRFVHTHRWRVADVLVWDNGCTLHRARPFDDFRYRRVLHRTGVNEPGPLIADSAHTETAGAGS